jgi:hypothetical protein
MVAIKATIMNQPLTCFEITVDAANNHAPRIAAGASFQHVLYRVL